MLLFWARRFYGVEAEHGERRLPAISPLFLSAQVWASQMPPLQEKYRVGEGEQKPGLRETVCSLGWAVRCSASCARNEQLREKHACNSRGAGYHVPDRGTLGDAAQPGTVLSPHSPYLCWSRLWDHLCYFSVSCTQTTSFHLIHT